MQRSRKFMQATVDILRTSTSTSGNDVNLGTYSTVASGVPCMITPAGSDSIEDANFLSIGVDRFSGGFLEGTDLRINDVLKRTETGTTIYYEVVGVTDFSDFGFPVNATLVKKNYQRGT